MTDSYAFTNIYKLYKNSSLKYGPISFSIKGSSMELVYRLIDGEIILEKYTDGKLEARNTSKNVGVDIIEKKYSNTHTKPLMKKLFLESINKISNSKDIFLEYEIAELSDYSLVKKSPANFTLKINGVDYNFLINHIENEAIYRINGREVGFYEFVNYIRKNSLDFKLSKKTIIKNIEAKKNVSYGASVMERNFEELGINRKKVNGRVEVDFNDLLKKQAKKVDKNKKNNFKKSSTGYTKSNLLDKILLGKEKTDNFSGKVLDPN